MANKNQVIGRARVKIDGVLVDTGANSVTLDPGGITREPVPGDYNAGAHRISGTRPAKLDLSILAKSGFSARAWEAMTSATISIEFDTGDAYVMREAYAEGAPPITTSDGLAKAVAYSQPAEQVS